MAIAWTSQHVHTFRSEPWRGLKHFVCDPHHEKMGIMFSASSARLPSVSLQITSLNRDFDVRRYTLKFYYIVHLAVCVFVCRLYICESNKLRCIRIKKTQMSILTFKFTPACLKYRPVSKRLHMKLSQRLYLGLCSPQQFKQWRANGQVAAQRIWNPYHAE